ncbi:BnaC04g54070D [Brassica napus]|uniref:F-box domain-containing protein n=2 Tax=Brassica TaxID=3705 RepID=A0A3P6BW59_BRAOL|nr:unnamed protein product [Brassica napus]CDY52230.1 BnaC04g54070D [Brassica napus]VDD06548.1 unnamed protein product [Brassica oleracea]
MSKEHFSIPEAQSSTLIPVDLLISIFSLVPAKSAARFRCVSKFWASIIRRRDFTELFLSKSFTRPRLFFALHYNRKLFLFSTPQPHNPDGNTDPLIATPYYNSFPEYFPSDTSTPVCGLVLLHGWRRKVRVICNPATGEFLTLPKVLLKEKNLLAKSNQAREEIASMYLGYDPMGKQFKVLCMTTTHYGIRDNTHQVLTLGSGKRFWRPVQRKFQFVENRVISREICINGVLYFGARTERSTTIVCFDVGSEKFSFINTNRDMMYSCYMGSLTLFNYKGRLAIHRKVDSYQKRLMFWVIEDAENHKWSKHIYELSPLEKDMISYSRFVGMTGTGELVWSLYREPANSVYLTFVKLLQKSMFRDLKSLKSMRMILYILRPM